MGGGDLSKRIFFTKNPNLKMKMSIKITFFCGGRGVGARVNFFLQRN